MYNSSKNQIRADNAKYKKRINSFGKDTTILNSIVTQFYSDIDKLSADSKYCFMFINALLRNQIANITDKAIRNDLNETLLKFSIIQNTVTPSLNTSEEEIYISLFRADYKESGDLYQPPIINPITLNDTVNMINNYIYEYKRYDTDEKKYYGFLIYLDIIIGISERDYAIKQCRGEVDSFQQYINNKLRGVTEDINFYKCSLDIKPTLECMTSEYKVNVTYQTIALKLQEYIKKIFGDIPKITIANLDEFLNNISRQSTGKNYYEYLEGSKSCCGDCIENTECFLNYAWTQCSLFTEKIPKEILKQICPDKGLVRNGTQLPNDDPNPCQLRYTTIRRGSALKISEIVCSKNSQCNETIVQKCNTISDILKNSYSLFVQMDESGDVKNVDYNGKTFCQIIDKFYSCCEKCISCQGTDKFCGDTIPPNVRQKYLEQLKDSLGEKAYNILIQRINNFNAMHPFSKEAIDEIKKRLTTICKN